ncbi:BREX-1 system phosphatase PglZ type B [Mycolicibacterium mucogenicum]|uniref:BREX-1 system phosphatase PglZ type B n=1 Tax=Mycolicibacterium mucogenicum TaxID=56689 RepID=UPI00226A79D3|nr:BREX-1 system phosphatase PglZ type B [Mycolicibacterium mucogenicum]MCX8564021.1 BREX-1 system phosphatase PglZ type B [Mycolicibacterium mucogenicum]
MTAVRELIAHALREAAKYNAESSVPPAAVFWPDPDLTWKPVIGILQEVVPILVLGPYDAARAQGPAIWIRAALSAPNSVELPSRLAERNDRNPWVVYLPGHGRGSMSDVTNLDSAVSPLLEVALRSNWWPSAHGQAAWTPHAFLGSKNGAGLDIAGDANTKSALASVLDRLLAEDVDDLRRMGRLDASRLHSLVMTDSVRTLLEWLDDPGTARSNLEGARWNAFVEACRSTYGFNPDKDGALTAAGRLGTREGAWSEVWARFADNPRRYPNVPGILDKARPEGDLFGGADPHPESWPSWNQEQEDDLRTSLATLGVQNDLEQIRTTVMELAATHLRREDSVWAELGQAPLARATGYLAEAAELATATAPAGDLKSQVAWYAAGGYKVDDLALRAIAAATTASDRDAVCRALKGIYDPWLDAAARAFQSAATAGYNGEIGLDVAAGTCVVFVDALRFDLAWRLAKRLAAHDVSVSPRLAAFPTVTPTGQPAVAPVATRFMAGQAFDAADPEGRSVKGQVFRSALAEAGVQYLDWKASEVGDVNKIGWTQTNTIDALGHDHGHSLVDMLDQQIDLVAERIRGLLVSGWRRVVVVTDHGFIMPASPALKVNLPLAVTEGDAARKPRVARLKAGALKPDFPIIPWTWDSAIEMVSAPGAAAFESGTIYEHGGLSPQECVIPIIEVATSKSAMGSVRIAGLHWTGQRCRIDFEPAEADVVAEVRLAPSDAASVAGGPKSPGDPGEIKVLVDEERAPVGATAYVVLLGADGSVVAQRQTKVGDPL